MKNTQRITCSKNGSLMLLQELRRFSNLWCTCMSHYISYPMVYELMCKKMPSIMPARTKWKATESIDVDSLTTARSESHTSIDGWKESVSSGPTYLFRQKLTCLWKKKNTSTSQKYQDMVIHWNLMTRSVRKYCGEGGKHSWGCVACPIVQQGNSQLDRVLKHAMTCKALQLHDIDFW